MTHEQMMSLKVGTIVTHASGNLYRVISINHKATEQQIADFESRRVSSCPSQRDSISAVVQRDGKDFGCFRNFRDASKINAE